MGHERMRRERIKPSAKGVSLMRPKVFVILSSVVLVFAGCKSSSTTQPVTSGQPSREPSVQSSPGTQPAQPAAPAEAVAVKPSLDACALLTTEEIRSVQGEAVKETKLSGQTSGGFSISQCFFTLPTFNNSISLQVTQKGEGAGARDPKDFWRSTFHDEKAREEKEGEREKESEPPQKVSGVGEEAFWMGSQLAGALYVLKGNSYVRVSIGGPMDDASKKRAKSLAQKVIARL
jgi:hypothetical protein